MYAGSDLKRFLEYEMVDTIPIAKQESSKQEAMSLSLLRMSNLSLGRRSVHEEPCKRRD